LYYIVKSIKSHYATFPTSFLSIPHFQILFSGRCFQAPFCWQSVFYSSHRRFQAKD
jgi:hypothetical protein